MQLKSTDLIQQFLEAARSGQITNDASERYGVQIKASPAADGELYWRVIAVHHLLPAENDSDHTILVEALDEQGNRIRQGKAFAASTFSTSEDPPEVKALDKGDADPMGCDFPMFKHATYSAWMQGSTRGAAEPSERVEQLHTRHPDEAPGNTIGHHSFYIVFQRSRKAPSVLDATAVARAARTLLEQTQSDSAPFAVYARLHQLGAPITVEFSAGGYRARGYVGGIVYAPIARPTEIQHMAWEL